MRASTVLLIGLLTVWMGVPLPAQAESPEPSPDIEVFVQEGCPHCAAAKIFLEDLRRERPALRMLMHDVGKDKAALARMKELSERFGVRSPGVPTFHLRGEVIVGYDTAGTTGRRIRALLDKPPAKSELDLPEGACPAEAPAPCGPAVAGRTAETEGIVLPFFGRVTVQQAGLPLFTFAIGLLDGFNPCAMWVLLFLLSLLVNLQDRFKMCVIAGTFVAVSGLAYFAFMAAWLNVFLLIGLSHATQLVLGGIAGVVGAINVKEFFAFGRGVSLAIPDAVKPGFYARIRRILQAENLAGALAGVVVLAVLVNIVELLCTAGFPAVYTQILALRRLPWWEYYGYLGLYNVAYMLDDGVMVTIAVATLGRRKLQEKEGRWLKLINGVVMLGLGVVLIVKPEWLAGWS